MSTPASIARATELPMADNGIGRDFITIGATRSTLEAHGFVLFGVCTLGPAGPTRQLHGFEGLPGLFVLIVDDVVRAVAVVDAGFKSITGNLRVGDSIDDIRSSYQQRISDGEDALEVGCAPGMFVAWKRDDFRLVFAHDNSTVTSILGVATTASPELTGDCALEPREEIVITTPTTEPEKRTRPIDTFVPQSLAGSPLAIQDVSSADIEPLGLSVLWWGVTTLPSTNVADFVGIADSGLECLYEDDVVTVGIYNSPGAIVVAYETDAVDLLDLASCTVVDYVVDTVCVGGLLCSKVQAATAAPAGGAYRVTLEGREFVVAYATLAGTGHARQMCAELAGCPPPIQLENRVIDLEHDIPILVTD